MRTVRLIRLAMLLAMAITSALLPAAHDEKPAQPLAVSALAR